MGWRDGGGGGKRAGRADGVLGWCNLRRGDGG